MDNNTNPQDSSPKPQGVMDIQPPKPPVSTGPPQPSTPPAPTLETPPTNMSVSQAVHDATEHPPAAADAQPPTNSGFTPELLAKAQAETNKPQTPVDTKHHLPAHAKKSGKPKLVIVIAIVVALALSGVAVYAYMQSKDNAKTDDHTTQQHSDTDGHETTTTPADSATTKDVDDAVKEVDGATGGTDEATDLPDGGLNDSTMGM